MEHVTLEAASIAVGREPEFPPFEFSCSASHSFEVQGTVVAHDDPQEEGTFGGRIIIAAANDPSFPDPIAAELGVIFSDGTDWTGFVSSSEASAFRSCTVTDSELQISVDENYRWGFSDVDRQISLGGPAHAEGLISIAADGTVTSSVFTLFLLSGSDPAEIALDPSDEINAVGTSHTVYATVRDFSFPTPAPVSNAAVVFVVEGSSITGGHCRTDEAGQCEFTYSGPLVPGTDRITAFADTNGDGVMNPSEPSAVATKTWRDTTPPVITCASDVSHVASAGPLTSADIGTATATDGSGGTVAVTNDAPEVFGIGVTMVTWLATDLSGNTDSCVQTVTILDDVPPSLAVPANMLVPTDPGLATSAVTYPAPTATDNVAIISVVCTPSSGSTFPFGNTTVTCTATDGSGNSTTAFFTIGVVDTEPPTLIVPTDITVEATGPGGATVASAVTATDNVDVPIVLCSPASGSTFPLGITTVTCTGTDGSGNTATASFAVMVVDTTSPDTALLSAVDGNGRAVAGGGSTVSAAIEFVSTGTDLVGVVGFECSLDSAPFAACVSPQAYTGLAVGGHAYQVRALDAAGNQDRTPASFAWIVVTPAQATQRLIDEILGLHLPPGVQNSLTGTLRGVVRILTDEKQNNDVASCGQLAAFINIVSAKAGNGQLMAAQADDLRQSAEAISASIGCP